MKKSCQWSSITQIRLPWTYACVWSPNGCMRPSLPMTYIVHVGLLVRPRPLLDIVQIFLSYTLKAIHITGSCWATEEWPSHKGKAMPATVTSDKLATFTNQVSKGSSPYLLKGISFLMIAFLFHPPCIIGSKKKKQSFFSLLLGSWGL